MKGFRRQQPPEGKALAGGNPADPIGAGGGTIGKGIAPVPQEQGFSGNEQGAVEQPQGASEQPSAMGPVQ